MAAAHVPSDVSFATKPTLARVMIERAIKADVPFSWVAADSVYGVGEIEMALKRAGKGYVLGVSSDHHFNSWGKPRSVGGTAATIAESLDAADWVRLPSGEGTKGPRLHDWAYLDLADLDATEFGAIEPAAWTRGLLIRRAISDGELAFFSTWCPVGTSIETLVRIEGHRWAIEDSFETAKNELGLDHNETRSWHGWHRHVSLVMLAFAMMATIRHHANREQGENKTAKKNEPIGQCDAKSIDLIRWSMQEIRRIAVKLCQRQIQPAHIIAWSIWRRAHQAAARQAHSKMQL